MKRIGIIGANGKLGTELSLFLLMMEDIQPVAICRSELSAAFLRRCGVECRVGSVEQASAAGRLLEGCDVVCDLSLPRGLVSDIRSASDRIILSAVQHSPEKSRFVFASSIMALGMRNPGDRIRWRLFAGTSYGANKRSAERTARRAGRRWNREVYILRLGQVHGEIQPVSRQFLGFVDRGPVSVPAGPSYAIFVFTVAESLRRIALGGTRPGCYMGVEAPDWTWEELHLYFARRAGIEPEFRLVPEDRRGALAVLAKLPQSLAARGGRLVRGRKEFLSSYVLCRFPELEFKAKAAYMVRNARTQIALGRMRSETRPYDWAFAGPAPGTRVPGLPDSRAAMEQPARRVRTLLEKASPD